MYGLKELLVAEEMRLTKIKELVNSRLAKAPDGTLKISSSNKCIQYKYRTETERKWTYLKKEYNALAYKLAQKAYDQKIEKLVDRRLRQLHSLCVEYSEDEIEKIYNNLHMERKKLVKAVEIPWEQRIAEWKSIPYVGKSFDAGAPEIYTKKGERVRSKSEKILADTFYELGIEYKYECPLKLKGGMVVYPDFTFLRKRDCKEVYWEHDGRMDDPGYSEKAIRKLNSYLASGIGPDDNLVVSFESSKVVLDDRIIRVLIDRYLM